MLWIAAAVCGSLLISLEAADTAKKKGAKAPPPAKETPKTPPSPKSITISALADSDEREDAEIVKMKALKGDLDAQFEMVVRYEGGYGVEKNLETAFMWLRKSAEGGNVSAQTELAVWYSRGTGVKQDWTQAFQWSMKAAEGGSREAMYNAGWAYMTGNGVPVNIEKMLWWFGKSAEAGFLPAQRYLGAMLLSGGNGAGVDQEAACKWFAMGAEQDDAECLYFLGVAYFRGEGVPMDKAVAVRLWQRAAEQGHDRAQVKLGSAYYGGKGIVQDQGEAYIWFKLAAKQGNKDGIEFAEVISSKILTQKQITAANARIARFKPRPPRPLAPKPGPGATPKPGAPKDEEGIATGTGFFITQSGYLVTNYHVVRGGKDIQVLFAGDKSAHATVVAEDEKADLAILKVKEGVHPCLPIVSSGGVKLGASVATVGFPNPGVQGFAPKLAKGEIASLAGIQDDPNCFQISVPLQPGNSGGGLVDAKGNVVGVVCANLNQEIALATTGTLANSVGYAVKSSLLLKLAESVPYLEEELKHYPAKTVEWPFEDIVSQAQCATVLVVVGLKE
jgi:TPR repeat protein